MINIAMIGAGYWGKNICRNLEHSEYFSLVSICDKRVRKAKHLRDTLSPNATVTRDITDILEDDSIHAVSIVTPVLTHYKLAKECLNVGKHVLIEKPMAMTSSQAEELISIARNNNLVLMCDHTFCYSGPVIKIREVLSSGEIGNVIHIKSVRANLGLLQKDVNALWDLAPHDISIINFVCNVLPHEISSVLAVGKKIADYRFEVDANLHLEYIDGMSASIHNSWLYPTKERTMCFIGDQKMLVWDDLADSKLLLYNRGVRVDGKDKFEYYDHDPVVLSYDSTEPLAMMVADFASSIRFGHEPISSCVDGYDIVKILEASNRSLKNNKVEKLQ